MSYQIPKRNVTLRVQAEETLAMEIYHRWNKRSGKVLALAFGLNEESVIGWMFLAPCGGATFERGYVFTQEMLFGNFDTKMHEVITTSQ